MIISILAAWLAAREPGCGGEQRGAKDVTGRRREARERRAAKRRSVNGSCPLLEAVTSIPEARPKGSPRQRCPEAGNKPLRACPPQGLHSFVDVLLARSPPGGRRLSLSVWSVHECGHRGLSSQKHGLPTLRSVALTSKELQHLFCRGEAFGHWSCTSSRLPARESITKNGRIALDHRSCHPGILPDHPTPCQVLFVAFQGSASFHPLDRTVEPGTEQASKTDTGSTHPTKPLTESRKDLGPLGLQGDHPPPSLLSWPFIF